MSIPSKRVQGYKHYFGRTLDNGEDLGAYFGTPSAEPIIPRPAEPAPTDQQGRSTVFTQCSRGVVAKLEALDDYKDRSDEYDVAWLFQQLGDICNQFEKTEQRHLGLFRAMLAVVNHRQNQHQTTSDYYDTLMDLVSVYEAYGGQLHNPADNILTDGDYAQMTTEQLDAAMRDYAIATIIIENSDDARYSALKKDLCNHYSRGTDQYPRTGSDAYAPRRQQHEAPPEPQARQRRRRTRREGRTQRRSRRQEQ